MVNERRRMGMPGVEFEGPMGMFWSMKDVPFEAMTEGIAEIVQELLRRGYRQEVILESVKAHFTKGVAKGEDVLVFEAEE